ncbi:MAG: septum formation inhibitor Maf [Nitrospiraceae bacterium]|nr:MAG: septum formation inhibitor Maf [Nitrospiraceae bacterium]
MRDIVLASASPRRKKILSLTGLQFKTCVSNYKEDLTNSGEPRALARFLSRKKAEDVVLKCPDAVIIAADTFIVYKNKFLGKPTSPDHALRILKMLNGKKHSVITGFTVIDSRSNKMVSRSMETNVYFKKNTDAEIHAYVRSGEPLDKAGAYAIQGLGSVLIKKIDGDFFNIVGLPVCALVDTLKKFGISVLA